MRKLLSFIDDLYDLIRIQVVEDFCGRFVVDLIGIIFYRAFRIASVVLECIGARLLPSNLLRALQGMMPIRVTFAAPQTQHCSKCA